MPARRLFCHPSRWLAAVAAVGALATISACGGDDDDAASSPSAAAPATTTSAAKPAGAPIKVMVVASIDTPIQNNPDVFAAAKAAANAINGAGGVNGQPIQIVTCNDRSDPNGAGACGRQAVAQKAAAVTGYSIGTAVMLPILAKSGIQYIGGQVSTPPDYTAPNSWPLDGGTTLALIGIPMALKQQGAKSIVSVVADISASVANIEQTKKGAAAAGVQYVNTPVKIPIDATDYAPYVEQLKNSGADSASISLAYQQILQLTKAAAQLNLDMLFGNQALSVTPDLLKELGSDGDGMAVAGTLPSVYADIPSMKQFNAEMDAAGKAGVPDTNNRKSVNQDSWLAIHAIAALGERISGTIDAASLTEALKTEKNIDVVGLLDWTPSAPGPTQYPRVNNGLAYPLITKDGKVVANGEAFNVFDVLDLN